MEKFVFVVFKGLENSGAAIRAIALASKAAAKGHHVEVFLMDDAVIWAQLGMGEWLRGQGFRPMTGNRQYQIPDAIIPKWNR